MKLIRIANLLLGAIFGAAGVAMLAMGVANAGATAAFALPALNFAVSYAALRRKGRTLLRIGLWFNILLLAFFVIADAIALYFYSAQLRNSIATVIFQAVLIALPASLNILALSRLKALAEVSNSSNTAA